jgi:ERF superfamily
MSSRDDATRSLRYAPLSGRQEIVTLQAAAIDTDSELIRLTTMLAHSSGEWMSSDWPVCPLTDTASPQRMGAALTYARRFALFALVGIAGEDDLDAPDLPTAEITEHGPENSAPPQAARLNGEPRPTPARRSFRQHPTTAILSTEQSSALRERLVSELQSVQAEELAHWAQRIQEHVDERRRRRC